MSSAVITLTDYKDAVQNQMGWCHECQDFTSSPVEPDTRGYVCENCDGKYVYGAEEALLQEMITIGEANG